MIRKLHMHVLISVGAAFVLFMYLLPLITEGQDLYVSVYDVLDGIIPTLIVLTKSGAIWADSMTMIPDMMYGLPRISYGTEFRLLLWLFYFFPPFTAYAINEVLIHIVAFGSMLLLLSYLLRTPNKYSISVAVALMFSLMPIWPMGSLSIPLMPLTLLLFLRILHDRASRWEWAALIIIPLTSNFVVYFFFFLAVLGVYGIIENIHKRRLHLLFWGALLLLILLFMTAEYRLVGHMLWDSGYVSHRVEMTRFYNDLGLTLKAAHLLFINGHPHADAAHFPIVLPFILLTMILIFTGLSSNRRILIIIIIFFVFFYYLGVFKSILTSVYTMPAIILLTLTGLLTAKHHRFLFILMGIQLVITYWFAFWYYESWQSITQIYPFLEMFNLSRFNHLQPFIWYLLLALSVSTFDRGKLRLLILLSGLLIVQIPYLWERRTFSSPGADGLTFRTYYAKPLFDEISTFINRPKTSYRVISLGIHPTVALFNGFYTLDGYSTNYPLAYAHLFAAFNKRIVNKKSNGPNWTSKCYVDMDDRHVYFVYDKTTPISYLDLNLDLMKSYGLEFIFSGYEILDPARYGMTFLKKFSHTDSYWDVYLYSLTKGHAHVD